VGAEQVCELQLTMIVRLAHEERREDIYVCTV
jgi:hypothetical protein